MRCKRGNKNEKDPILWYGTDLQILTFQVLGTSVQAQAQICDDAGCSTKVSIRS